MTTSDKRVNSVPLENSQGRSFQEMTSLLGHQLIMRISERSVSLHINTYLAIEQPLKLCYSPLDVTLVNKPRQKK